MAPARFKIYAERYGKLLPAGENSARQRNESAFSGTPCQVAGLRSFLKKDYGNLYCLDIICHGVPSAQMFLESLRENFGSEKNVDFFTFRNKTNGWNRWHSLKISAGGSEQIIEGKTILIWRRFSKTYVSGQVAAVAVLTVCRGRGI